MIQRRKKSKSPCLWVWATEKSDVREVEPDGTILPVVRFVGKRHNPFTYQEANKGLVALMEWEVMDEAPSSIPYSSNYVQQVKLGHLRSASPETSVLCGVQFPDDGKR